MTRRAGRPAERVKPRSVCWWSASLGGSASLAGARARLVARPRRVARARARRGRGGAGRAAGQTGVPSTVGVAQLEEVAVVCAR